MLAPAEAAAYVVVGTITALRQLDAQGWAASIAVERALVGGVKPPLHLRIAWEELAPSRAVRFANGARVLLALEALPNGSLWTQRFPKRDALVVANRGEAFSRETGDASISALASYLALPQTERVDAGGAAALAELARRADSQLALEALARLGALPALATKLGEPGRAALAALLADATRGDELRAAALGVAGRRKLLALAPEARKLAAAGSALAPFAIEALGAMGALSREDVQHLAASRDSATRAAVLRGAPGALEAGRLAALAKTDAAGAVRAAALEALVAREGARAADAAVEALFDADADVQAAALRALPAFPAAAAPLLRARVFGARANDTAAIKPALAGLSQLGRPGHAVLSEIEQSHPNEELQRLARFLLGRDPAH